VLAHVFSRRELKGVGSVQQNCLEVRLEQVRILAKKIRLGKVFAVRDVTD